LNSDNLNTCSTLSEDASVEDEGIISSYTEELEESDEDEYLDLDEMTDAHQTFSRQIHLVRHPQFGIGLSVQGGSDFSMPVMVSAVKPDGPADKCGLIFVGDQIIQVNDVTIDETTCHKDALRLLSECGDHICLGMHSNLILLLGKMSMVSFYQDHSML